MVEKTVMQQLLELQV